MQIWTFSASTQGLNTFAFIFIIYTDNLNLNQDILTACKVRPREILQVFMFIKVSSLIRTPYSVFIY